MGHEPRRSSHDLGRAAVVRLEVHATQAGQATRQVEDAPDVREAPGVDGLVIVADEEDVPLIAGEQDGKVQLRPVEVLRLIHEEDLRPRSPARQERRVRIERGRRPRHEVVEVDETMLKQVGLVLREGLVGGDVGLGRAALRVELEPGEGIVEPAPGRLRQRAPSQSGENLLPIGDGSDVYAGLGEDGPAEGMERAHADAAGSPAELRERSIRPLLELLGRPTIEGQRADRGRVDAERHTPGDARHHRGRLARSGRRDTEHGSGVRGGRGALVRGETGEPLLDGLREEAVALDAGSARHQHARPADPSP